MRSAGVSPGAVFTLWADWRDSSDGRNGARGGVEEADGGGVVSAVHALADVGAFAPMMS